MSLTREELIAGSSPESELEAAIWLAMEQQSVALPGRCSVVRRVNEWLTRPEYPTCDGRWSIDPDQG